MHPSIYRFIHSSLDVAEWNIEEVCQWFEGVGFGEYTDTVRLRNLKGEEMCNMRIEDMQVSSLYNIASLIPRLPDL